MKYLMIAQTTAKEGREQEFNDWYDNVHLAEVLALPGFQAAQRFGVASGKTPFKFYAAYEVEADNAREIWQRAGELDATMTHSDDLAEAGAFILEAIGGRVVAEDGSTV
jgi:hypothetical protein